MGVPKFFRYISERYPCLSEMVCEHQIPEFDNLYLDMNGIIHNCSHPNDNDPHFRITEENIFKDIFHYIEILFRMIQPKKLFLMAVDGVAPRAKMNQQRGRRFRTAKEMLMQEEKAKMMKEKLPDAERFDSNCITPGTVFMARLQEQLRYFVKYKVSTDKLWQKPTIILSGHETPGEGEHKIMDYIRYMKSQPNYDSNTRHCLYGLDADLMMLGLCSHEPHFALLREEVKFGKSANSKKRASVPEDIKFYLLHLSLMRHYIDLEFQELKTKLPFPYNIENIIDDWVLMGFLVGNDFIPHLPNLHIANGALPILYRAYIDVLPYAGGYINEGGQLNLSRFQKYMEKLSNYDMDNFKDTYADLKYFHMKTGRRPNDKERTSYKCNGNEDKPMDSDLAALISASNKLMNLNDDDDDDACVLTSGDEDNTIMFAEFDQHKNDYYISKLEYEKVTPDVLRSQAECYVRAIQWNLNYYYNGCCSWSWFYPHHYAPFISDIKNFKDLKLEFELGTPFLPFQQLLAVLPAGSKTLLPEPFQELMVYENSPIIDFYPVDFKTDMNGKKQEWEAVVLIPFIDQDALISAMDIKYDRLTDEEKRRNRHGPMLVYNYTKNNQGSCRAPAYFPTLKNCFAVEMAVGREEILVEQNKLVKGLCPGINLDVYIPGFPTLKYLDFTASLKKDKVKVFESPSRGDNMILYVKDVQKLGNNLQEIASNILGKSVYLDWPHLHEAKVVAIANNEDRYLLKQTVDGSSTVIEKLTPDFSKQFNIQRSAIKERYLTKMGIHLNNIEIIVYACQLEGRKYEFMNDGRVSYDKKFCKSPTAYALQLVINDIEVHEAVSKEFTTIEEMFKPDTICFTLGTPHYGAIGTVIEQGKNGRIKFNLCVTSDPDFSPAMRAVQKFRNSYVPGHVMAQRLSISSHMLSRITGCIFITESDRDNVSENTFKTNVGLNLKFTKRNEVVCGYTKRENNQWLYSEKAYKLINDYMQTAPEFISHMCSNTGNDFYYLREILPENGPEKLRKLTSWLEEQDHMKAERMKCSSKIVEEEVVKMIENIIDSSQNITGKTIKMQIKPHLLLLPKSNISGLCPDANATHQLFDRVTCVRESFTVPLGLKGTIIGIHEPENGNENEVIYDIVFDKEFVGGVKLRCSTNRGYRLTRKAFLNISHGLRLEKDLAKHKTVRPVKSESTPLSNCNDTFHPKYINQSSNNLEKPNLRNNVSAVNQGRHQPTTKSQEFQDMWNTVKAGLTNKTESVFDPPSVSSKAGLTNKTESVFDPPSVSSNESDFLKRMLKINSTKEKSPDQTEKLKTNTEMSFPNGEIQMDAVAQLENYLTKHNMSKPLISYRNGVKNGKVVVTADISIQLNDKSTKTFTGAPSSNHNMASESAAYLALNLLTFQNRPEIHRLTNSTSSNVTFIEEPTVVAGETIKNPLVPPQVVAERPIMPRATSTKPSKTATPSKENSTATSVKPWKPVTPTKPIGLISHPLATGFVTVPLMNQNSPPVSVPAPVPPANYIANNQQYRVNNWMSMPTPPQQWHHSTTMASPQNKQNSGMSSPPRQQYPQIVYPQPQQMYVNINPGPRINHPPLLMQPPAPVGYENYPRFPVQMYHQMHHQMPTSNNQLNMQHHQTRQSYSAFSKPNNTNYQDVGRHGGSNQNGTDNSRPSSVMGQPRRSRIAANFNIKMNQ